MFSRAFPQLQPRGLLAQLDAFQAGTASFAGQLAYCQQLTALVPHAARASAPLCFGPFASHSKPFTTTSPHFELTYHTTLLAARFVQEELTSLHDPAQLQTARLVAGLMEWEAETGAHQRDFMRTALPAATASFESQRANLQVILDWMETFAALSGGVHPSQIPQDAPGLQMELEQMLMEAHLDQQVGRYTHARKLFATAKKRFPKWVPPQEWTRGFLDPALAHCFIDHPDSVSTAAGTYGSSASCSSAPPRRIGTAPDLSLFH